MEFKGTCLACGAADLTATETKGRAASIYVRCDDCQAQTFIRTRKGIKAFTERYGDGWRTPKGATDGKAAAAAAGKSTTAGSAGDRDAGGGPLDF